jgi:hypothetical protein
MSNEYTILLNTKTIYIYFPRIGLTTTVVDGKLLTSAAIVLAPAKVKNRETEDETWEPIPSRQFPIQVAERLNTVTTINIPNVLNLDADIVHLTPNIVNLYTKILTFVASVNEVRQLL